MNTTQTPETESLGKFLKGYLGDRSNSAPSNVVHLSGSHKIHLGGSPRQESLVELANGLDNIRFLTKKEIRDTQKFELSNLIHKHKLNFVYVREIDKANWDFKTTGGTVIAYRVGVKGGSVIEMSTAICSNSDNFDKLRGRLTAAMNFDRGARVKIKLPRPEMYTRQLEEMFESGF